jgi:hypothetical protein
VDLIVGVLVMVKPVVFVDGSNVLYRCPFCKCMFCTVVDFELHVRAFSSIWAVHAWYFVAIHAFDPKLSKRERAIGFAQLSF